VTVHQGVPLAGGGFGFAGGGVLFVGEVLFDVEFFVAVELFVDARVVRFELVASDDEGGGAGVAVTVAVTVTVGRGDSSSACRGSLRGGSTTTPTRSRAEKFTYGLTVPVCACPDSGDVAVTTWPTGTPQTNGFWSFDPWVTRPSPGLTRAAGSMR
jgi:hypothetical protein